MSKGKSLTHAGCGGELRKQKLGRAYTCKNCGEKVRMDTGPEVPARHPSAPLRQKLPDLETLDNRWAGWGTRVRRRTKG